MPKLTLDTFITAGADEEKNRFLILQGLKPYYDDFSHSRLYPALSELIELHRVLEGIIQEKAGMEQQLPHELKEIDLPGRRLRYEPLANRRADVERVATLIEWTLPHLRAAIREGMGIYDFVDEHLEVEEVGIMPMYREEGYCFIPDNKAAQLHLLRYEVSLFSSERDRYRTLRTRLLKSIEQRTIRHSPEILKLQLVEEHDDLPNPATYCIETDLDFPFNATILPVAKRKLMQRLSS